MIVGNDISCMYVCACVGLWVIQSVWLLSILIIILQAVNTRDRSRQALWCCTTSPSLPSLPLGVAHCFSSTSTSTSSTKVHASLSPSINPSITQSSWRGIRCNMSLSLLNGGIVVSERERERERERECCCCCCCCSLASRVRVCYDTANSLSQS